MLRKIIGLVLFLSALPLIAGHRFHATAMAVAGERGSVVGSVSLSPEGGDGSSVVRDYDDGFVRFSEATSVVRGIREGNVAITSSVTTIRNLDIGGRIHADAVIARVNERHAAHAPEAEITFEGSSFENLTIDGQAITAVIDNAYFAALPTFESMKAAQIATSRSGAILCTATNVASCGAMRDATWQIAIPGLGSLSIGEVLITNGHRELNMLRLEREKSPEGGNGRRKVIGNDGTRPSVIIGSATGNGTDFGPP